MSYHSVWVLLHRTSWSETWGHMTLMLHMFCRYMKIRYEDICLNPSEAGERVINFLGYSQTPDEVLRFVQTHTKRGNMNVPYSTFRNSKDMMQKWRQEIVHHQLKQIEDTCDHAIRALGFRVFHDIQHARNLNLSVFNDEDPESYFQKPDGLK
ncbi:carbohydrate sulfotransferase 1-like [Oratosquilla oratoria]|uniref:carbohydrate sulfotransferase 1-like n=1 Tax=Oratosquilla oratoria TaxID=337810 RepID=UPI003F760135